MTPAASRSPTLSLATAVLLAIGLALLAGIVPAGLVLDRWLAQELKARARRDLEMAPALLTARDAALHDAMMMHAKDLAHGLTLAAAMRDADRLRAMAIAGPAARALHYEPVLVGPDDSVWEGPAAARGLVPATRRGEMPVAVVADGRQLSLVSLAAVMGPSGWQGAVGVYTPLDEAAAGVLAALTRSDVVVLTAASGSWVANAGADSAVARVVRAAAQPPGDVASTGAGSPRADPVREITRGGATFLVATVPLGGATAVLARDLRRDLAIVPRLRWVMFVTGLAALVLAVLLGALLARRIARPVRMLASAAARLSAGDFDAPLDDAAVREVERVTVAFREMRRALAGRIQELRSANRLLEERQTRLAMLQTELIQRERVATSARMVAELAHEIRNPVANVRNCLELIQRRLRGDPEGEEYASLAIDELLRMHELAERILDLNRPREPGATWCDAAVVAREVITLARLGDRGFGFALVDADGPAPVAVAPDALKQVLLNLVRNAREAVPENLRLELRVRREAGAVRISVADNGPGVPAQLRERIFDPFFTTRGSAGGVGLGLFLVEGIVRANGGSVSLRDGDGGACFEVVLPAAEAASAVARSA